MKARHLYKKSYFEDYVTVFFVRCPCGETCAKVMIRPNVTWNGNDYLRCDYCGVIWTEATIKDRVYSREYSISKWKEEFGYGKRKGRKKA